MKKINLGSLLMLATLLLGGFVTAHAEAEIPDGYQEMEFNHTYTPTSVGQVKLYYTAPANGILRVTQTGSYDSHLFDQAPAYSSDFYYNLATPLPTDFTQSGGSFQLEYAIGKGMTYYVVAKLNPYDDISALTYEWIPDQVTDNIVELGTPYTLSYQSPVYTYIADADGILSVEWSSLKAGEGAFNGAIAVGQQQFFLYTSAAHTPGTEVPPLSVENGETGYIVKFSVKEGDIYYLYLDSLGPFTCVFSLDTSAVAAASITNIEPVPGSAYDVTNFRYYWNMQFSPNGATVESVELTYIPNGSDTPTTIEVPMPEMGGDAYRIPADNLVALLESNSISPNTFFTYTFHGLKAGGIYVSENKMEEGSDYVTIGEDGEVAISFQAGKPITPTADTMPRTLYQKSSQGEEGTLGTITYDGEVSSAGEVSIIEGHVVQGGQSAGDNAPASISVPSNRVSIAGNVLTIDFGGLDMTTLSPGEITVYIAGVKGTNGLYADYSGNSVGTYYVTLVEGESSGIADVEAQDGVYHVYNLNGILVLTTDNAADLRNLNKGVYIVNGKKYVR